MFNVVDKDCGGVARALSRRLQKSDTSKGFSSSLKTKENAFDDFKACHMTHFDDGRRFRQDFICLNSFFGNYIPLLVGCIPF